MPGSRSTPQSSVSHLLTQAESLKNNFEPGSESRLSKTLAALGRRRFNDAAELHRYHELLLYCRAFPRSPGMLSLCENLLEEIPDKARQCERSGADMTLFDAPEVSGVSGTAFTAIFSYGVAERLAQMSPEGLGLDWDAWVPSDHAAETWRWLFPLVEEDTLVEPHVPFKDWLLAAAGSKGRALTCLLERIGSLRIPRNWKAGLYNALQLPLHWELGNSRLSRTLIRAPYEKPFYHREPLIRRTDVSVERELASDPIEMKALSPEGGEAFLNMAVATCAVRQRELYGFTYGDPYPVQQASLGRGVDAYLCGLPPGSRLPLRAYHAGMLVKNGIPIGYVEALSLCDRIDVGFNLYYTFRDGETAWMFARLLHVLQQVLGSTCFAIDPYQIGRGNEEAIESGAFWFYRKLGFRPVSPEVVRVLEPEECRMMRQAGYRSRPAVLRKLAGGPMVYETTEAERGAWDRFHVRNIGLAVQSLDPAEAVASVSKALGIQAGPHGEYAAMAQLLALIPDLAEWSEKEKADVVEIICAKMGPSESHYVQLSRRHEKLRAAILALGAREAGSPA